MMKNLDITETCPMMIGCHLQWKETNKTRKHQLNYERHENELGQKKKWPPKGSPLWVQMEDSIKEKLLLKDWWLKKNKLCRNKKRWKVWTKTIDHLQHVTLKIYSYEK